MDKSASTSRQIQVPGATVIAYYVDADGQSGNLKVGYDVARFEKAVRDVFTAEAFSPFPPPNETETESDAQIRDDELNGFTPTVQLKPEDIRLICSQLEVSSKVAEKALTASQGNLKEALLHLVRQ